MKISQAVYRNRTIYVFRVAEHRFVRGAFFGRVASVTDPQKRVSYGILIRKSDEQALSFCRNCLKMRVFNSKITYRKGYNVVYIKGSEEIADILDIWARHKERLNCFRYRLKKEMRNEVNRRVNCENANTNKAAKASSKHFVCDKKNQGRKTMGQNCPMY